MHVYTYISLYICIYIYLYVSICSCFKQGKNARWRCMQAALSTPLQFHLPVEVEPVNTHGRSACPPLSSDNSLAPQGVHT